MAKVWIIALFVLFNLEQVVKGYLFPIEPRGPLAGNQPPPGSVWPLPQEWHSKSELVAIGKECDFEYVLNVKNCEPLDWAVEKFNYKFLFGSQLVVPEPGLPLLTTVFVNISKGPENLCDKFPNFSKNSTYESYDLRVVAHNQTASVVIEATTVWGALRGLETFTHLLHTKNYEEEELHYYANVTEIKDWPRFPHRGIMVDTARHYLPVSTLIDILDAMFHNKFNVIHWHIVDDQSFPFVSKRFPDLSAKGAYNNKAIYSPEAVHLIITQARLRGIRVILEFDTPGHSGALGRGQPAILTPCYGDGETPGTPNYPEHAAYENVDPTKETTYEFMRELFTEILEVTEDEYVHLGMDEVYYPCWNSSPAIKEFMKENGYDNLTDVQDHYTKRHLQIVSDLGGKFIIWQDPIDAGVNVSLRAVIQMWKDYNEGGWENDTQKTLDMGYQVLISAPWYLNYINYGQSWRSYYEVDPVLDLKHRTPGQEDQILGGEVCMWGEYVDTTNVVPRLFPFASAVAERLWSAANSSTTDDAMWRLDEFRCRLLWRGIPAQPILNGYCGPWEVDGIK